MIDQSTSSARMYAMMLEIGVPLNPIRQEPVSSKRMEVIERVYLGVGEQRDRGDEYAI